MLTVKTQGSHDTSVVERGQKEGDLRKRPIQGQAAACWAQVHGLTMLLEGLEIPAT
jgi:hypothetical protein